MIIVWLHTCLSELLFLVCWEYIYFSSAHTSYLGFIYLDATYNNAVMHVFLHLLQRETKQIPEEVDSYTINNISRSKEGTSTTNL